jgi:hypothetical protein
MMPKFKDRKPALAGSRSFFPVKFICSVLCVVVLFLFWYGTRLVVAVVPEGGKTPFCFVTYPGDEWHIALTHSVEKTEWDDYFRVNAVNNLTMTHTRFESLGWGYPYSPNEGKLVRTADGKFDLEMNRPYKELALRISEQAMQHIVHGRDDYDLIKLYGQGTAVKIKLQYRYAYWFEKYF